MTKKNQVLLTKSQRRKKQQKKSRSDQNKTKRMCKLGKVVPQFDKSKVIALYPIYFLNIFSRLVQWDIFNDICETINKYIEENNVNKNFRVPGKVYQDREGNFYMSPSFVFELFGEKITSVVKPLFFLPELNVRSMARKKSLSKWDSLSFRIAHEMYFLPGLHCHLDIIPAQGQYSNKTFYPMNLINISQLQ
jgi:hypothetical protein